MSCEEERLLHHPALNDDVAASRHMDDQLASLTRCLAAIGSPCATEAIDAAAAVARPSSLVTSPDDAATSDATRVRASDIRDRLFRSCDAIETDGGERAEISGSADTSVEQTRASSSCYETPRVSDDDGDDGESSAVTTATSHDASAKQTESSSSSEEPASSTDRTGSSSRENGCDTVDAVVKTVRGSKSNGSVPAHISPIVSVTMNRAPTSIVFRAQTSSRYVVARSPSPTFPSALRRLSTCEDLRPVHPTYRRNVDRARSFERWPAILRPLAGRLVDSGFFYTGRSDEVACHYCGARLSSWRLSDVVHRRHDAVNSGCPFAAGRPCLGDSNEQLLLPPPDEAAEADNDETPPPVTAFPDDDNAARRRRSGQASLATATWFDRTVQVLRRTVKRAPTSASSDRSSLVADDQRDGGGRRRASSRFL